ncbi:DUF6415 family natural product biosynthesis protein [Streptomyces nigra]|uniref:DUF6415 family natural product biosynthesis protein n=1 Tax=Streptomyces nigra TaxID=1827580 RepID=UPI0036827703
MTVRQSCQAFLSASQGVAGQAWEGVGGLLRGHVQLLVPAFAWVEPQFRGEQWRIAQQILTGARQRLAEGIGTSPRDIWDLAVGCRALLVLLEYPGPLRAAGPGGWS